MMWEKEMKDKLIRKKKIDLFLFTNDTNIYRKFQEVWNLLAEISELNQLQKTR